MKLNAIDKKDAKTFFNALYGKDIKVTFSLLHENSSKVPVELYDTIDNIWKDIVPANTQSEYNIFFAVNRTLSKKRGGNVTKKLNALFIDIDNNSLPTNWIVEPSIITEREGGNGYHVYWLIEEIDISPDALLAWQSVQNKLISFYNGDPQCKDVSRVLRVPYTYNTKVKYDKPFKYVTKELNENKYTLEYMVSIFTDSAKILKHVKNIVSKKYKNGVSEGERNGALFYIGQLFKLYGIERDTTATHLDKYNRILVDSPLDDKELESIINNVYKYGVPEGVKTIEREIAEQKKKDHVESVLESWYYIQDVNVFVDITDPDMSSYTKEVFNNIVARSTGILNTASFAFVHNLIKQLKNFVYEPEREPLFEENGQVYFNMWRPTALLPTKKKPKWFIDHIKYLTNNNKEETDHVLNYMAHIVQYPRIKINHAILFINKRQGSGRSLILDVLKKVLGEHNTQEPGNNTVGEKYNGWCRHCQLAFIQELDQGENKRGFENNVKSLITESRIHIREMYQNPYYIRNYCHIISSSNKNHPTYLEREERRWFIVKTESENKENEYYKKMYEHIENDCGQVLHFLQNRDLTDFNPKAKPMTTDAKRQVIEYSESDFIGYVRTAIEEHLEPFEHDIIMFSDVSNFLRDRYKHFYKDGRLKQAFEDLGVLPYGQVKLNDGKTKRFWAVRDHDKWFTGDKKILNEEIRNMYIEENAVFN